jgi:2-phospho-L-lactate guanylyltransferase
MMWLAVVPVNYGRECKTRLASRISRSQRAALVEMMARHVVDQLRATPFIDEIWLLSPQQPPFDSANWMKDQGRGLNVELEAARAIFPRSPIAFVHADLPFLRPDDARMLLDAAHQSGVSVAPDRREVGTNALAIADSRPFLLSFGPESFSRHHASFPDASIVRTDGLGFDLDEEEDLDMALARGFALP